MGRVLLSRLDSAELERRLAGTRLVQHTAHTLRTVEALRQELQTVRKQGFAVIDQELELGLRSIAVPILDGSGKAVAAINIGIHAARASTQDMIKRFLPLLQEAAEELSLVPGQWPA
jgi:IclR family pca regulon transcriptional regulator